MALGAWSEARAALHEESWGAPRAEVDGRWWYRASLGFWRPVDFLTPFAPPPPPPRKVRVGYHCLTSPADANSLLGACVIPDLGDYGLHRVINANRRKGVRRSLARNEIEVQSSPDLIIDQGYPIVRAAMARTGQRGDRSLGDHRRRYEQRWLHGQGVVVAASRDGRLGGFMTGHVIGPNAYLEDVTVSDEAQRWHVSPGLYQVMIEQMQQLGAQQLYLGWWIPDLPTLAHFKKGLGGVIQRFPAHVRMSPAVAAFLRRRRPVTYLRLGGRDAALEAAYDVTNDAPAQPPHQQPQPHRQPHPHHRGRGRRVFQHAVRRQGHAPDCEY